jgi:hypothetical protein
LNGAGRRPRTNDRQAGWPWNELRRPAAYARGLADLQVLSNLVPANGFVHGPGPTSVDAAIYGFIANIYFYDIDTPLKQFVAAHANLVRHCTSIHAKVQA